ncbi:MAG: DNA repair protein RadC [Kiritimatiellae bacterium]|nr:DNA repair protein RadC [Kiritimatiellia bacterium]
MTKKRQSNFVKNGVSSEQLPREQMERAASPHDLKDEAVLAILLKTGAPGCDVLELARRLIRAFGCIQDLVDADWRTLLTKIAEYNKNNSNEPIKGIGKVKALELAAAFELGYRRLRIKPSDLKSMRVRNAEEAYQVFKFIAQEGDAIENFWVLPLNVQRRPLCEPIRIARGTANSSGVMPRDVFREAIRWNAHCIVVAHNHPNGDPAPSDGDIETTRSLMLLSKELGIPLIDHLVIATTGYVSIRESLVGRSK